MELIRITDSHNPLLSGVPGLYESAFPAVARIPSKKLLQLIDKESQMAFNVITVKGKFCGMAIVWDLDKFRYLEYFAMLPHCRCQGIGTEVLGELCRQSSPDSPSWQKWSRLRRTSSSGALLSTAAMAST